MSSLRRVVSNSSLAATIGGALWPHPIGPATFIGRETMSDEIDYEKCRAALIELANTLRYVAMHGTDDEAARCVAMASVMDVRLIRDDEMPRPN